MPLRPHRRPQLRQRVALANLAKTKPVPAPKHRNRLLACLAAPSGYQQPIGTIYVPDLAGKKTAYFGFSGLFDSNGVTRVATALNLATNNGYDEAYICLNSIGGYVSDGVFLYNHIKSLPIKTICHNTGGVHSIAVTVFVAAAERYCSAHSMFLIHPTTMGPLREAMTWERLDSSRDAALADDERTENILRERTGIPDDFLSARRVREVYITPQDALKFGIVHAIREFALPKGNEIIQI